MTDDLAMAARFEQLYHGHGRGKVIRQGTDGFAERAMTMGELAARVPAERIARNIYRIANYAGMAYIVAWDIIAPTIDIAVLTAVAEHYKKAGQAPIDIAYADAFKTASEHCGSASKQIAELALQAHQLRSALMLAEQKITALMTDKGRNPDVDADMHKIRAALLVELPKA